MSEKKGMRPLELFRISNLKITFPTDDGEVKAVNTVDLVIEQGDVLGLLGESGSGKTILGKAVMRLLHGNVLIDGDIQFKGKNMVNLDKRTLRKLRGKELGMVLQNPSGSLNPSFTIGNQIAEIFVEHNKISGKKAKEKAVSLLEKVKIPNPKKRAMEYPHQYSGGMKERAVIAMGIANDPDFIMVDEPTKGLDVIVKYSIVKLLKEVVKDKTMLMITHDISVAENLCTKIGVMYLGELVELTTTEKFFQKQNHPYSQGLLQSAPSHGMIPIPGYPHSLIDIPEGCRFFDRCGKRMKICKMNHPPFVDLEDGGKVRCFLYARSKGA